MLVAWVFWLSLLAPGACLHALLRPRSEPVHTLEVVAVGYVLSFALLAPGCIVGYALELPLWTLSAAIVVQVGVALLWLGRRLWQQRPRVAFEPWALIAAAALFVLLLHAAAMGGHLVNDADFHLARVRFLYDHGLSNRDPYTATGFTHPYHTNLLHALVAAGAQLTHTDPLEFWQATLPFAKLAAASGVASLCLRLGGTAFASWLTALFTLGSMFLLDWTLYPNQLAAWWLVPVGLSATLALLRSSATYLQLGVLAATALVLSVTHGLYAGFLGVLSASMLAPVLGYRILREPARRRQALVIGALATLALALPLPSLYVARWTHSPRQDNFDYQGGEPTPRPRKPDRFTGSLRIDAHGSFAVPADKLYGGDGKRLLLVLALGALALRRRYVELAAITAALALCMLVLGVPGLSGAAIKVLGAAWILERLTTIVGLQHLALVGAALVPVGIERGRARIWACLLPPVASIVGILYGAGGLDSAPEAVMESLLSTDPPSALRSRVPEWLDSDRKVLGLIPAGSTVLTHPLEGRQLRKLRDLEFIRVSRNHTGVDDLEDRTIAMQRLMYAKRLTPELRKVLVDYDVHYGVQAADHPIRWLDDEPVVGGNERITVVRLRP